MFSLTCFLEMLIWLPSWYGHTYTSAMIHWKFKYYIFIHTTKSKFLHVVLNMYFDYTVGNRFLKDSCKDSLKHLLSVTLLLKTGQLLWQRIALLSPPFFQSHDAGKPELICWETSHRGKPQGMTCRSLWLCEIEDVCIWAFRFPSSATEKESLIFDKMLMPVLHWLHGNDFRVKGLDLQRYQHLKHWLTPKRHLLKSF